MTYIHEQAVTEKMPVPLSSFPEVYLKMQLEFVKFCVSASVARTKELKELLWCHDNGTDCSKTVIKTSKLISTDAVIVSVSELHNTVSQINTEKFGVFHLSHGKNISLFI